MYEAESQSNRKIQFNKHERALTFKCDSNKPHYSESSFPTLRVGSEKMVREDPLF